MGLKEEMEKLGTACRHYDPRAGIIYNKDCGLGHKVRDMVAKAAGTNMGTAFMMPCRPGPQKKIECNDYDPKTEDELAEEARQRAIAMDRAAVMMRMAESWRKQMVIRKLKSAVAKCPVCLSEESVRVTCAIDYNKHLHAKCGKCGAGFME
jgi:hypothetical protein